MLPETPCTQFAHNLWKGVIINDKRNTPVNDILFLAVSFIGKYHSDRIDCYISDWHEKRDKLHTGSYPLIPQ